MRLLVLCAAVTFYSQAMALAQGSLPRFRQQLIDDSIGDCWGLTVADINADGKTDVVALSYKPARVVWYENPTWTRLCRRGPATGRKALHRGGGAAPRS